MLRVQRYAKRSIPEASSSTGVVYREMLLLHHNPDLEARDNEVLKGTRWGLAFCGEWICDYRRY
jgi:hypothetical protein